MGILTSHYKDPQHTNQYNGMSAKGFVAVAQVSKIFVPFTSPSFSFTITLSDMSQSSGLTHLLKRLFIRRFLVFLSCFVRIPPFTKQVHT